MPKPIKKEDLGHFPISIFGYFTAVFKYILEMIISPKNSMTGKFTIPKDIGVQQYSTQIPVNLYT